MFDALAFDASRKAAENLAKWQQGRLIKDQPHRHASPPHTHTHQSYCHVACCMSPTACCLLPVACCLMTGPVPLSLPGARRDCEQLGVE